MRSLKRHSYVAFGLLCAAVLALTGCEGKIQPKLVLQEGESRVLRVNSDMTSTATVMGQKQTTPENTSMAFGFDVESVDPGGAANVKVTFQEAELPGMGQMGPMAGAMGDMADVSPEGKSFTMTIKPDGTVESVNGMSKVIDEMATAAYEAMVKMFEENPMMAQMMGQQGGQDMSQVKDMMKGMMEKMYREHMGDEAMREQMESLFSVYPEQPVGVGDQWLITRVLFKGRPMVINETYTLKGRKDGVLLIDFQGEILPNESARPMDLGMGMKMSMEFTGTQNGSLKMDEKTGWILSGTADVKLDGTVKAGPMSMPTTSEGTVTFESEQG